VANEGVRYTSSIQGGNKLFLHPIPTLTPNHPLSNFFLSNFSGPNKVNWIFSDKIRIFKIDQILVMPPWTA